MTIIRFDPDGDGAGAVKLVRYARLATPQARRADLLFNLLCEATVYLAEEEGEGRARERLEMAAELLGRRP